VLGGIVTLGFLFLPGMRDVERSGELAKTSAEPEEPALLPVGVGAMVPLGMAEAPLGDPDDDQRRF
jgi:hypothetical protein